MSLNPLPKSLHAECERAAKILNEFCIPNSKAGLDKLIPQGVLGAAKGLAIITVVRAGFLVSVRAGSGLVVARLRDGSWSAPSCIGLGGIGGGLNIGGEVTNIIITLNSDRAIQSFTKVGQVTLGGSLSVAAGPVGRNAAADVALRKPSAFYTYSRSRGLYAGMSIEGAVISERKGANRKVYGQGVRAAELLAGKYQPPAEARPLYLALEKATGGRAGEMFHAAQNAMKLGTDAVPMRPGRSGSGGSRGSPRFSFRRKSSHLDESVSSSPPKTSSAGMGSEKSSSRPLSGVFNRVRSGSGSSGGGSSRRDMSAGFDEPIFAAPRPKPAPASRPSPRSKSGLLGGFGAGRSAAKPAAAAPKPKPKAQPAPKPKSLRTGAAVALRLRSGESTTDDTMPDWNKDTLVEAVFDHTGSMDCDLSFAKGDKIKVLMQTSKRDDWWEGELRGKVGIFPANFTRDV